jgi:hypothetical protein
MSDRPAKPFEERIDLRALGAFAAAGRMADMHHTLEVEMVGQPRQVVGVMIHIMAAAGLGGAPIAAPVVGDHGSPCRGRTDPEAAKAPNIVVSGTESRGFDATPIVTWSLILGNTRNLQVEAASVKAGGWRVGMGVDLPGKTLTLLGLGEIGQVVAR